MFFSILFMWKNNKLWHIVVYMALVYRSQFSHFLISPKINVRWKVSSLKNLKHFKNRTIFKSACYQNVRVWGFFLMGGFLNAIRQCPFNPITYCSLSVGWLQCLALVIFIFIKSLHTFIALYPSFPWSHHNHLDSSVNI